MFQRYLDLLIAWNQTHRITGVRSRDAILRSLFLDSLLFLAYLPPEPLALVDIGSGPGIPGVPLRIVRPELALTLVESRRKRVSFLASLKRTIGLEDVVLLEGRAERLLVENPDLAGAFDVVVVRAVGSDLLSSAKTYLKPGGLLVAGSSPGSNDAMKSADTHFETRTFPLLNLTRSFLTYRKPA